MARRSGPLVVLLFAVGFAPAQDLPPPSPLDLARGLRENGMPDLALEYLTDLAGKASPEVQKVLPLERAKCRLELATAESDDTLRAALVSEAKQEFERFTRANPGHPRLPEAAVALAQLQTLDGKTQVQRARRLPEEQQAAELAKARPLFVAAGKQFAAAADGLRKLADKEELDTPRYKELTQAYLQATLDQGVNLYLLADSYGADPKDRADTEAKLKAAKDAGLLFDGLWARYKEQPQGWLARAWAAECQRLVDERLRADTAFKALLDDATKVRTPASAAGARLARFFNLREEFVKFGGAEAASNERLKVRAACQQWLKEFAGGRATWEVFAVRYYLGRACLNEGLKRENLSVEQVKAADPKDKPTEKVVGVKEAGLLLLREADAQFKILVRTENEFTERATRQRPLAVRWLVGNLDRPADQFGTFDDAYMAALVQLEAVRNATAPAERAGLIRRAIALLERANGLPVPPESVREAARAQLDLARAYLSGNRPHAAAVYAEHLARTARSASAAARAGGLALDSYSRAVTPNEEARAIDRERRVSLAKYLEKAAPAEPETDAARMRLGGDLYGLGRKADAFEAFSRVSARSPALTQARLYEGVAAFELIRPLRPDESPRAEELPADKKASVYQRAVADLSAVPAPPNETKDDPAGGLTPVSDYFNLRLQLAQLHLTQGAKGYAAAEQAAVAAAAAAAAHPGLSADDKLKVGMQCESQRLRAVYGQAMPLYAQGKYAESAERFSALLAEVLKAGPAVKPNQPADVADLAKGLDALRISLLLVPTLNARVREGAVVKTGELLDELKKFGGDLSTSARVVQQGVAGVRPAVEALRKEGKDADADKLVTAVSAMVAKLAAEPNLPMDVRMNLGRSFRDLGQFAKAVELLAAVPAPANPEALKGELKPAEKETPEQAKQRDADNAAAPLYRLARLELIRSHRLDKKYDEAAAVLDDALGKEAEKNQQGVKPRAGGWASRSPEFRKEAILLIEAKAAAAEGKAAFDPWNEAIANWRGWAGEYFRSLNALNQPYSLNRQKRERLAFRLRLIELLATKEKVDYKDEVVQAEKELEKADKKLEKANAALAEAAKGLRAVPPGEADAAREKVEAARDAADEAAKAVAEFRYRPVLLAEYAKLAAPPDWDDEAKKAQKELDAVQKEMGEQERKMNPLKAAWQDVLSEQFRCVMAAQASVLKDKPTELEAFAAKHAKTIADFEKGNRPMPTAVRQRLFDLLQTNETLKAEYAKAGGIDLLAPPSAGQ
jgi:hypothetical protein